MLDYNRTLYSKTLDFASTEYAKATSEVCVLRSLKRKKRSAGAGWYSL